jgi:hypothetical protein
MIPAYLFLELVYLRRFEREKEILFKQAVNEILSHYLFNLLC